MTEINIQKPSFFFFDMYNVKIIIYKCQKYYIQCVLPYFRLPAGPSSTILRSSPHLPFAFLQFV